MNMQQLMLPGMGEAFELPLLARPKYIHGKKLTKKARWYLRLLSHVGVPRYYLIPFISEELKRSNDVSYSHTYIESMANIVIAVTYGNKISTFYNPILKQLYLTVGKDADFAKLYEIIESYNGVDSSHLAR